MSGFILKEALWHGSKTDNFMVTIFCAWFDNDTIDVVKWNELDQIIKETIKASKISKL